MNSRPSTSQLDGLFGSKRSSLRQPNFEELDVKQIQKQQELFLSSSRVEIKVVPKKYEKILKQS